MSIEIEGQLKREKVKLGPDALSELYDQGFFGRPKSDGLELSLVEAAFLLDRMKIKVSKSGKNLEFKDFFQTASSLEKGFEFRYIVYKDLRERGYYVQPGRPDFRVYPRGGHPGKSPAEFYVLVISERMPLLLSDIVEPVRIASQMRKKLMLAIVDEESDITFYEVKEKTMSGKMDQEEIGGKATLLEDRVLIWDHEESYKLHERGFYGKPAGERLQLSMVESAYLLEKNLIEIIDKKGKVLDFQAFRLQAKEIESDFDLKYMVYRDLRDRKMVVKTGFKFGSHFRVYKEVKSLQKVPHSDYLVHTIPMNHVFLPPVLSRAVRLAHSVRKQMIFAYPNDEIKYMEISRLKP